MKAKSTSVGLIAAASLFLSSPVIATPSSSSPYFTDPQNEYVQDVTSDAIGSVNMVLCIMNAMNISGSSMLNVGPYVALIDMNKCQSHGNSGDSSGGSSGASAATNYMTAIVDATRASNSDPMIANLWMSMTESGHVTNISARINASEAPSGSNPYGVFRMDYIGKSGGATQFNGYIDSATGALQFYETGSNSSDVALTMTAVNTSSGSGTMTVGAGSAKTFNFNYDPDYFRRSDGTHDRCFDRLKAHAARSVWRLGTYNANDGSRVDQTNPSFQIIAGYMGSSYYGNAGYYGINFQGLDLNGIADASPISGLVITDQRPGNSTSYNVSKVSGKLNKWTQNATTLAAMDGIPFYFSGDLTGLTSDNSVTGWGNWQMQWNDTAANFTVIGTQNCGGNGCNLNQFATPATVNSGAFDGKPISGWSDSFGGNINIPASSSNHLGTDAVSYFSQSVVIPGSPSAPTALYCLSNCPDTTSVAATRSYSSGNAPSPFGGTTGTQWFSAPDSAHTVSYTFDSAGLKNAGASMIIDNAAYLAANPMVSNGVMSGRLFDSVLANCPGTSSICEPSSPAVYYTWSTGVNQWNQSLWLTKSDSSVVAFDPPQTIAYTVPSGAAYGSWANKTIQLQFNGFGNLYGIPGYCVNPMDNSPANCSTAGVRYVPEFSIPDGATMSLGGTPIIVKALDAEVRLHNLGAGAAQCSAMTLTPLTPPAGGTHDMTDPNDAFYIGAKPTIADSPKVIDGIVQ
ncbi:MAG: hypothetical protein WA632_09130 [Gallionella sp.]